MSSSSNFIFNDGVISNSPNTPSAATFLESHPGAYTTTRTHNNASSLLFWSRHLQRLSNSVEILSRSNPGFLFKSAEKTSRFSLPLPSALGLAVESLVNRSVREILPVALRERRNGEELAITAVVSVDLDDLREIGDMDGERAGEMLDVSLHIGRYVPSVFGEIGNGARLALVGRGRDFAEAKYSDWARLRKSLEKLRPPLVTELLLSNDGDHVLEGSITNFFAVRRKDNKEITGKSIIDGKSSCDFEVQTAPISAGVLPGIIRQLVIEVCLSNGIPVKEVAPSWSTREFWEEAFITSSLRILQHVEKIQVPSSWESVELKTLNEISWEEKHFGDTPGKITEFIQKEIMKRANAEESLYSKLHISL